MLFIFGRMQDELGRRGPWLAGATFSLGDISMLAIVHRIFELYPARIERTAFPVLNDWWDRAMARPAAQYVYTNGTEETPRARRRSRSQASPGFASDGKANGKSRGGQREEPYEFFGTPLWRSCGFAMLALRRRLHAQTAIGRPSRSA